MNRMILFIAIVAMEVMIGCSSSTGDSKQIFNHLSWMEGKWISIDVTNYSEIWKRVNDTCYQGLSTSPDDAESLVEERLQIVLRKNSIHFINEVQEQTEEGVKQDFELISNSPDSLVFSNSGLNYPNRITYKKMNDSLIRVKVERKSEENQIKFEYTLKKMK